jgi:D-glycero-alpha-D-manno-heptose-7-phosphate kinase
VLTGTLAGIFAAARETGALGWKVCGAGGGGFAVLLVDPRRRADVSRAVAEAGGRPTDARPTSRGLTIRAGG